MTASRRIGSPTISVVLPVLNNAAYLPDAIESILAQSFADLELIAVDDGSNDASPGIAADYARRDSRVRQILLERDPALTSGARAANAGIAQAQGAYIARMDSDDIALPGRLAAELDHLNRHGLDICGGQAAMFGDEEKPMWYPQTQEGIGCELFFRSGLLNPTLLVRGEAMRKAGYDEQEPFEEYEFQTRMWFEARMGNVPQLVHRFRSHPLNTTRVLEPKKAQSRWRMRFKYFFRRHPGASLDDFQVVHCVAWGIPFQKFEQLELAGSWLVKLSRVEEEAVRARARQRWLKTCALATVADARLDALTRDYAERIAAPPA